MRKFNIVAVLFILGTSAAFAEDWPAWRGPRGDGTSVEQNLPVHWNGATGENIAWKTPVPGEGHGSPIVVKGRVFLLSCLVESQDRILVCFDRTSGGVLWQKTVLTAPFEGKHRLNSYASATPASDGELVYATFLEVGERMVAATNVSKPRDVHLGQLVVAAYDFEGNQRWLVRPGEFSSVHGFCSNPVVYGDLLIVNGDHDGDSYIVALSRHTGETVWKSPRANKTRSYVTPLVREIGGRPQMVLSGSRHVASLDPRDGSIWWTVDGPTEQFVASPVFDGRRFYIVGGFPTFHVMGIRPDGSGNVTASHVDWHVTNASCYVPSPVVIGDYLLVADDRGTAGCFDAATGRRHWQARLGAHYSASLVAAAGKAFFTSDDGITKIVEPAVKLQIVAENPLGEECFSSPALSEGKIILRGVKHLVCIGAGDSPGQ